MESEEMSMLRKQQTREAISLAMQSRWEEAVVANRSTIEIFPTDIDAYNRLGRALVELGNYAEAREAYRRALELDPHNSIARRNLERLANLDEGQLLPVGLARKASPQLFIEETGKTGIASLYHLAPREMLARVAAGDEVYLSAKGNGVIIENAEGEHLGRVEPKVGLRLARLMAGGNRYAAAITSVGAHGVRVIIKEVYQHPSQQARLSFPYKGTEVFRPYTKESLIHYELEDEEESTEEEYPPEWEGEEIVSISIEEVNPENEGEMEDYDGDR